GVCVRQYAMVEGYGARERQDEKWGEQNHPDIAPHLHKPSTEMLDSSVVRRAWLKNVARYYGGPIAEQAKEWTDAEHAADHGSWFTIHVEELSEALEAAALGNVDAL